MAKTKTPRKVQISSWGKHYHKTKYDDPAYQAAMAMKDTMERVGGAGPVRTLNEMSATEIAALETQYGCKVQPRQFSSGSSDGRAVAS